MESYFLINKETSIVENVIVLNLDVSPWKPPETHFILPVATTKCLVWSWDETQQKYIGIENIGNGGIGGVLKDDVIEMPKIEQQIVATDQPTTTGTQEL